jgi:cytochrome c oxidase subunit 2
VFHTLDLIAKNAAAAAQDPNRYVRPEPVDRWGQLTNLASTFDHVDDLFYFTYVVCIFFFLLITGVLGYSVVKYRRKTIDQPPASTMTHHTTLEVVWTVIPLIIVMVIFAWGWKGSLDMTVAPADARQYKALAKQWSWTFFYPNDPVPSTNELWLEVDQPAAFTLESSDVLHAFFIPAMRIKRDVVPGRFQVTWVHPTQIGSYHLFCAEYCGQDHSRMYAKVHVVSAETYAKRPWDQWDPADLVGGGEKIYQNQCKSCHSIDGSKSIGPTWKGLYGSRRTVLVGGSPQEIAVDDEYIIESVRKPAAKMAKGFETQVMTPFGEAELPDDRMLGVIEYMKTLK